jgi:hypothetical protein
MIHFNEDPESFISRFSKDIKDKFLEIFRDKYGYNGFIQINKAYNEYNSYNNINYNIKR